MDLMDSRHTDEHVKSCYTPRGGRCWVAFWMHLVFQTLRRGPAGGSLVPPPVRARPTVVPETRGIPEDWS